MVRLEETDAWVDLWFTADGPFARSEVALVPGDDHADEVAEVEDELRALDFGTPDFASRRARPAHRARTPDGAPRRVRQHGRGPDRQDRRRRVVGLAGSERARVPSRGRDTGRRHAAGREALRTGTVESDFAGGRHRIHIEATPTVSRARFRTSLRD